MANKVATASANGTAAEAAESIIATLKGTLGDATPQLVLTFPSTAQPLAELAGSIQDAFPSSLVLGASTAGEFTEAGDTKNTAAAIALAGEFVVHGGLGKNLKDDVSGAVAHATSELPQEVDGYPHKTAILLLDPLAGNGEQATLLLAGALGEGVKIAGGAAGDDLKMSETHVSCGKVTSSNALVVATLFSKVPLGLGVSHGHEPLSDPIKVTKADGGTVYEVEGRPAWDVWTERTRDSAAKRNVDPNALAPEDVGGYLLRYEAGLSTGANYKIRAPLSKNADGSLNFACGIPEGSVIRITESVPERQVDSAIAAARSAREQLQGKAIAGAVVFDCICRNLILGEQFGEAVAGMTKELGDVPIAGFETYGEIAMEAGDMSGFHNTTTVVLAIPA